jgi:DNA-binding response OmpR family regulator
MSTPKRILVVEDDADLRSMFRTALSLEGFEVDIARNGFEALQWIDRDPPDLLILDLGLPDMDGLTVIADLADQSHTRLPVIVVTARTQPLDADVRCVLRKPVTTDRLISVVKDCLGAGARIARPD